ncbi:MAG: glycerol-3-phosphate dehydrogenase subunit GlpB [Arachnia sp.]
MSRVIVVGAGLAGLTAALRSRRAGAEVTLINKGLGGLQLGQGSIDILGYCPERVIRPLDSLPEYVRAHPEHPYALLADGVAEACGFLAEITGAHLLAGDGRTNFQLPTAVGAIRPTAFAPPSLAAADVADGQRLVVVGLRRLKDFQPTLVAGNLARSTLADLDARAVWIDVEARAGEHDSSALTYARCFDTPEGFDALARALDGIAGPDETLLLPACLGLDDLQVAEKLAARIGRPVAEVALQPPSVPGMRLNRALTSAVKAAGVRILNGSEVTGGTFDARRITGVVVHTAGRARGIAADSVILAPGGFESGALAVDSHLQITERALGLPLTASDAHGLIDEDFWGSDQALFSVGVAVDARMRPVARTLDPHSAEAGQLAEGAGIVYEGLFLAGGIIAGANRWREKSGDGIAVASAVRAADSAVEVMS